MANFSRCCGPLLVGPSARAAFHPTRCLETTTVGGSGRGGVVSRGGSSAREKCIRSLATTLGSASEALIHRLRLSCMYGSDLRRFRRCSSVLPSAAPPELDQSTALWRKLPGRQLAWTGSRAAAPLQWATCKSSAKAVPLGKLTRAAQRFAGALHATPWPSSDSSAHAGCAAAPPLVRTVTSCNLFLSL